MAVESVRARYGVIRAESLAELSRTVCAWIEDGYEPQGGVCPVQIQGGTYYLQALVKR